MRFDLYKPVFITLLLSSLADVLTTGFALNTGAIESNPIMCMFGSSVLAICLTALCMKMLFTAGVCFMTRRWQGIMAIAVGGAQIGFAMNNMLVAGHHTLPQALMSGVLSGILSGVYIKNLLEDISC